MPNQKKEVKEVKDNVKILKKNEENSNIKTRVQCVRHYHQNYIDFEEEESPGMKFKNYFVFIKFLY